MKLFIIIYFVDDSGLMELNDVDFDENNPTYKTSVFECTC
jgi:hypothetical protein